MKKWGLPAFVATAAVLVAGPASGRILDFGRTPDGTADGAPDIASVAVGSNASGGVTFGVALVGREDIAAGEHVLILVDSDNNAATGEQPDGSDARIYFDTQDVRLERWSAGGWQDAHSQTVYMYAWKEMRIGINRSDLGLTSNQLRFRVRAESATGVDRAPDAQPIVHDLSSTPIRLTISQFVSSPKTVRPGKQYVVAMRIHRSDLNELASAGLVRCAAKYGTRAVKLTAAFPEDIAACVGVAPKAAKGKTLKITLTFELDGARVARTASIKVAKK